MQRDGLHQGPGIALAHPAGTTAARLLLPDLGAHHGNAVVVAIEGIATVHGFDYGEHSVQEVGGLAREDGSGGLIEARVLLFNSSGLLFHCLLKKLLNNCTKPSISQQSKNVR